MKALVKKSFDYSPDGISVLRLNEGEAYDIADGVFAGLVEAGLIDPEADKINTEADKKKNEKPAQSPPASGASKPPPIVPRGPISPASKA
jgi:hypothetical protein